MDLGRKIQLLDSKETILTELEHLCWRLEEMFVGRMGPDNGKP